MCIFPLLLREWGKREDGDICMILRSKSRSRKAFADAITVAIMALLFVLQTVLALCAVGMAHGLQWSNGWQAIHSAQPLEGYAPVQGAGLLLLNFFRFAFYGLAAVAINMLAAKFHYGSIRMIALSFASMRTWRNFPPYP